MKFIFIKRNISNWKTMNEMASVIDIGKIYPTICIKHLGFELRGRRSLVNTKPWVLAAATTLGTNL